MIWMVWKCSGQWAVWVFWRLQEEKRAVKDAMRHVHDVCFAWCVVGCVQSCCGCRRSRGAEDAMRALQAKVTKVEVSGYKEHHDWGAHSVPLSPNETDRCCVCSRKAFQLYTSCGR